MPITASPLPYSRPSSRLAAMPAASSVGWFGCSRVASRPGSPIVERKRVATRTLRATAIRSWLRISLLTAATISGVRPGASAASAARVGGVGQQPFAQFADTQRGHRQQGARDRANR